MSNFIYKLGSTGAGVKEIQAKLGLNPDGIFGDDTAKAVKAWQKSNGLLDDGIVGSMTWSKMFPIKIPASPFKLDKLRGVIMDSVILQIPEVAAKFNITTPLRLAHFLAQCAHESGNFSVVYENLNYDANGLCKTFPAYFPTMALALQYQYKPELIASRCYGSRMGNGNEASKEGWIFRGRGYIQLTGKNNYKAFDAFVEEDILNNPDLVATKYPMMSAAWFFHTNNIWQQCDMGVGEAAVKAVTLRVNGGFNGLADRIVKFNKFYSLLA
jgi:putative chitinase